VEAIGDNKTLVNCTTYFKLPYLLCSNNISSSNTLKIRTNPPLAHPHPQTFQLLRILKSGCVVLLPISSQLTLLKSAITMPRNLISTILNTIKASVGPPQHPCKNLRLVTTYTADLTSARGSVRKAVTPKDQYVAKRARGAYIATVSQPEAAFDLSFAAQVINPKEKHAKQLNKSLNSRLTIPQEDYALYSLIFSP
jgi:hypothetical protein